MRPDKASATAHLIAASTVFLSKDPALNSLVPSSWAEPSAWFVAEYSPFGRFLLRLIPQSWFRTLVRGIERRGVPGIILQYILRKHCLEKIAREHINEGYNQVVVLGAGFDTLALRLHKEWAEINFLKSIFQRPRRSSEEHWKRKGFHLKT